MYPKLLRLRRRGIFALLVTLLTGLGCGNLRANVAGGGTGTGANVTLSSNGSTFTMSNGIISITGSETGATITTINYTYNNGSGNTTSNLLSGGHNGGQFYWSWTPAAGQQGPGGNYRVVTDPTTNGGNMAEVAIYTTWGGNSSLGWSDVDVHYTLLRGSTGFYCTGIQIRNTTAPASTMAEWRSNIYVGSTFDWIAEDSIKSLQFGSPSASSAAVQNAPQEVYLWTGGLYSGHYEDKYDYTLDLGDENAWGWTSVSNTTAGYAGLNVGLWMTIPSHEYYNGGPKKREIMDQVGPAELNMLNGTHYGMGQDYTFVANESWNKVYGPYFIYCNSLGSVGNYSGNTSNPSQVSQFLWADAQTQAAAEQSAWPYSWFTGNVSGSTVPSYATGNYYVQAAGRGNITGKIVINDVYNPNASAAGLWVGVALMPLDTATYDFQEWCKGYEYWVKTDANGNFTIPNVIAGSNYTLYAFGPGAAGTFQSQVLNSAFKYYQLDLPATPFAVTVTGGSTTNLGTVTWTPKRVGPTAFEIGVPDRNATEFRHGDDYWRGDVGPTATIPSPIWAQHIVFPFDFPNGANYTVGTSRWSTDWNWVQPCITNAAGSFNTQSNSTINFYLPSVPTGNSSLYIGSAADYSGSLEVIANGVNITATNGSVTSNGNAITSSGSGFTPTTFSTSNDAVIRQGVHGAFADVRVRIPVADLVQGNNNIKLVMSSTGSNENGLTYDYLRLEVPGYAAPAPAGVAAYPGNNQILLSWPTVPGATSYNILQSTVTGGPYTTLASNVTGPVTGSGPANATYVDNTTINGNQYFYVVQSVNEPTAGTPVASANSAEGNATASGGEPVTAPATPAGVTATAGTGNVTVSWTASSGADYYTVQRATVENSSGAQVYTTLSNTVTNTTFTDATPSLGEVYDYIVSATNAAGTSATSAAVNATVISAAAPSVPPTTVTAVSGNGEITINWTAVSGAFAYTIARSTSLNGTYTLMGTVVGTSYVDTGDLDQQGTDNGGTLPSGTTYYYTVTAMNTAGNSTTSSAVSGTTAPAAPSVSAVGGTGNVTLSWGTVANAANYTVLRSTSSGRSYSTIASGVASSPYTNTGLTNGTTYYYEVEAVSAGGGASAASTEVGVTPMAIPTGGTIAGHTGNISLAWTAVTKAGSYSVYSSTTTGGPYTDNVGSPTSPSLADTSATSGTTYYYVVAASNNTVDGTITSPSVGSNSTELSATELAVPSTPNITTTSGSATLNWGDVTGAMSYNIYRSTTSGSGYVLVNGTITASPYVDSSLTNGTTYYYVIAAAATNSLSSNSTQISATPLAPPGSLAATAGTGNITLTWTASTGAISYIVKRGPVSGGPYTTLTSSANGGTYTDTTAVNGTPYFYVMSALSSSGVSFNSNEATATALSPPGNLTATPGNGNVSLNWSGVVGATGYTVKRSTTSGSGYVTLATGVSSTSYLDTTAANGTTYYYVVSATNSNGASNNSTETSATPIAPPAAPTNLAAVPGNTTVALTWSASANATNYLVQRATVTGGPYTGITTTAAANYTDSGLTDGVTYYYVVAATNSGGTSANSAEVSAIPAQTLTQWTSTWFPGISDANITGPSADPDGDGLTNLEEYLLGTNPTVPDSPGSLITTNTDGSGNLVITFRVSKNLTGVTYKIQESTDMINWTDSGVTPTVQSDQGTYYIMQAPVPLGGNPHLYLKVSVTGQ